MSTEEKEETKTKKYEERYRFWTDKALGQLSLSIEILFTLTVAVLGYVLSNDNNLGNFCWCFSDCVVSFKMGALLASILFILTSTFYGMLSLISRNLDLRLTRHIAFLRKSNHTNIKDGTADKKCFCFWGLLKLFFSDNLSIAREDYSNDDFMTRFNKLRGNTNRLGELTWVYNRYHIVFLFLGLVFYVVYRLANV